MLQNLPVNLEGYKLMVTEAPELKMFMKDGQQQVATVYGTGEPIYVISVFAKAKEAGASGKRLRGEEIRVELTNEPEEAIEEGSYVSFVRPTVSVTDFTPDGGDRFVGQKFRASSVVPATS
jgi:hypothetical protein